MYTRREGTTEPQTLSKEDIIDLCCCAAEAAKAWMITQRRTALRELLTSNEQAKCPQTRMVPIAKTRSVL